MNEKWELKMWGMKLERKQMHIRNAHVYNDKEKNANVKKENIWREWITKVVNDGVVAEGKPLSHENYYQMSMKILFMWFFYVIKLYIIIFSGFLNPTFHIFGGRNWYYDYYYYYYHYYYY